MENILTIENISKYYGNKSNLTKAISNISMNVDKGEFIAIMGASGSGKTTLLNVISTIDKVTSGHIYIEGQDITKLKGNDLNRFRREELGFIFQDFSHTGGAAECRARESRRRCLAHGSTRPRRSAGSWSARRAGISGRGGQCRRVRRAR